MVVVHRWRPTSSERSSALASRRTASISEAAVGLAAQSKAQCGDLYGLHGCVLRGAALTAPCHASATQGNKDESTLSESTDKVVRAGHNNSKVGAVAGSFARLGAL